MPTSSPACCNLGRDGRADLVNVGTERRLDARDDRRFGQFRGAGPCSARDAGDDGRTEDGDRDQQHQRLGEHYCAAGSAMVVCSCVCGAYCAGASVALALTVAVKPPLAHGSNGYATITVSRSLAASYAVVTASGTSTGAAVPHSGRSMRSSRRSSTSLQRQRWSAVAVPRVAGSVTSAGG